MTEAEIKAIVDKLADIPGVLHNADPEDKGEIFQLPAARTQADLLPRPTARPSKRRARAVWVFRQTDRQTGSEGDLNPYTEDLFPKW